MAEGALVFVFLFFAVATTLALYALLEAETSNPTVVDRREAEREARARGGLRDREGQSDRRERGGPSDDAGDAGWDDDRDSGWDDR